MQYNSIMEKEDNHWLNILLLVVRIERIGSLLWYLIVSMATTPLPPNTIIYISLLPRHDNETQQLPANDTTFLHCPLIPIISNYIIVVTFIRRSQTSKSFLIHTNQSNPRLLLLVPLLSGTLDTLDLLWCSRLIRC